MQMKCEATQTPSQVDIPRLRERYRAERDKRLRAEGSGQYAKINRAASGGAPTEDPHRPLVQRPAIEEDLEVAIVGGGWGGILASYHLASAGIRDVRNIDTAGDFGGVWYWNRYPGIQCDNDAFCYLPLLEQTGFMPSRKFSDGYEIQGYCAEVARRYGFAERALFHTQVTSLTWDHASRRWQVRTNRGDVLNARFVVMACGVLNMPKFPRVAGFDEFRGKIFHTARWDYKYTGGTFDNPVLDKLTDKRVAIVGTGATAIQAVPHLGRYAQHLFVVQRTPSSVDERPNPATDREWVQSLQSGWQKERQANFHRAAMEFLGPGEVDAVCDIWTEISRNLAAELSAEGSPSLDLSELLARREIMDFRVMERLRQRVSSIVQDRVTASALKPYYRFMCKRPLSSDEFYPTFNRENVTLLDVSETKGIERLTRDGIIVNGSEHPVDCIIFASGFEVTSELERRWGIDVVTGREGRSLYDAWREGPETLHGTMTSGFPNMFFIGYVQGGVNATVTEQFGEQARHIAHIISHTYRAGAGVVEPDVAAQDDYVSRFRELEIDYSEFHRSCPPGYFNNDGEERPKWALFRGWGPGWDAFQAMLAAWRERGDLEGLNLTG